MTTIEVISDNTAQAVSNYLAQKCPTILPTAQLNAEQIFVPRMLSFCVAYFAEVFQELGGGNKDYVSLI